MPLADAASYPLWANLLIFLAAAGIIWFAGARLTKALDAVAAKTGMERVFVGMLLLGGITSLPEVANVTTASSIGNPSLAVNNLLGSAAINILLLAIADAIVGRQAVTSIVAKPSTMMMAALCMIVLISIATLVLVGDVMLGPLGVGSLGIGIASLGFFWLATGYDERAAWSVEKSEGADGEEDADVSGASVGTLWGRVAFYGALLFASGYALSQTGDALAQQLGLTSAIVGFALIGTATSLPELVTVIVALRLGRPEMAFGQVLGTNFINLALLPLSDLIFDGEPVMNTLGTFEAVSALLGAILIGVFMVGLLEHRNRTIFKMGIDSAVVIALFAVGGALLAGIPAADAPARAE
jgi:cation:H+ antiporter